MMDERLPTIESTSLIPMDEAVTACCALGAGRFAVGTASGVLRIYEADALLDSAILESSIVGLTGSGEGVIAASELTGVTAFHGESLWSVEIAAGCEILAASGGSVIVVDAAGGVTRIDSEGEVSGRKS